MEADPKYEFCESSNERKEENIEYSYIMYDHNNYLMLTSELKSCCLIKCNNIATIAVIDMAIHSNSTDSREPTVQV